MTCTELTCPHHGEENRAKHAKRREVAISEPNSTARVSSGVEGGDEA